MKYKLEEICNQIYSGGTPSTSHKEYWGGELPWMTSGETSQRFVYTTEKFITEEGVKKSSTKHARKQSTVMASAGQGHTRGQVSFLMNDMYVNQSVLVFDPNEKIVEPLYLYYNLDGRYDELRQLSDGTSTRGSLSGRIVKGMEIELPELPIQKKIVDFLYNLDKKIENNNQINRNLSEQLRIVFEDMFITNAEDSWPEKKVGDFLELERGLSYKGKFLAENEGTPMLNLGNILPNSVFRPEKLKYYTGEYKSRHIVRPGDIIVANTDLTQAREVLGSAIRVPDLGYDNVICSHHISIVRNCKISNNFILGLLNMPAYRTRVAGFATGTTVLALPNDTILNCEFQCPTEDLLAKYEEIAEPIYAQMEEIRRENEQLSLLRDLLLPKLMSGEIDLSETI